MFKRFIDRMMARAIRERENREKVERFLSPAVATVQPDGPPTNRVRHFIVHDALNGNYIEYTKRKYNPNGPDEYAREIYIVQPGESLIDAISTVLVLLEK